MSAPRDPDAILAAWLEEGPTALPEPTRRAIAVTTRTTDQMRPTGFASVRLGHGSGLPRRFSHMPTSFKLAVGAMAVIAAVLGGSYVLGLQTQDRGIGGPSPSPSPSADARPSSSAGVDTTTWTTFRSPRYGYSVGVPPTFGVGPSTIFWAIPATAFTNAAKDLIHAQMGDPTWAASSLRLAGGVTFDSWVADYLRDYRQQQVRGDPAVPAVCDPSTQPLSPITVDGRNALLRIGCGEMEVLLLVNGRVYSFWGGNMGMAGSQGNTPAVGVLDSFRAMFEAWLSTIRLDPASALEPPAASLSPNPS
jgi:hypothetical protein